MPFLRKQATNFWDSIGDQLTYSLTLHNEQTLVDIDVISVSDPLLDDIVCTPAIPVTLPAGTNTTLSCVGTYNVTLNDLFVDEQCRIVVPNTAQLVYNLTGIEENAQQTSTSSTTTLGHCNDVYV